MCALVLQLALIWTAVYGGKKEKRLGAIGVAGLSVPHPHFTASVIGPYLAVAVVVAALIATNARCRTGRHEQHLATPVQLHRPDMREEPNNQGRQTPEVTSVERRVITLAALIIAVLAVQPLFITRLPERQTEFAWEMYAKGAPRDEFLVDYDDRSERITVTDVQPRAVATVDYSEILPQFICERDEGVVKVTSLRADRAIGVLSCTR